MRSNLSIPGAGSCLVAQFHMKRSVSFHLIQSYLPSILIVAISWVSFWMDLDSVPGRISLGVITLLAVSSQAGLGKLEIVLVPKNNWCTVGTMYKGYFVNNKSQNYNTYRLS